MSRSPSYLGRTVRWLRISAICAVRNKSELGSMGTPIKIVLQGQPVFLCCAACKTAAAS